MAHLPRELPLVGRGPDLAELYTLFGDGPRTEPLVILKGDGGVGKSRLARTVAGEARRRGWEVAYGRAYPVETGAPYSLLSDAFIPTLREMEEATLTVLTRGNLADVRRLFPALGSDDDPPIRGDDPRELQTRLYWSFTELVQRMAARSPLLIVLEDLHWADASSLALLHFLGRHIADDPVRILCTYNTEYREEQERLVRLERSFLALRRLRILPLNPLSRESTQELIATVFSASGPPVREFSDILYGWTRGNPYFLEQTLDALVSEGRLYQRDGTWLGWETRELELPSTVRDAILLRFRGLSEGALAAADRLAVVGSPTPVELLTRVAGGDAPRPVAETVEELVRSGLVEEVTADRQVLLQFRHPLTRETLYQRLSLTRRRLLHREVAEGLERLYGRRAMERADELAYHFVHGAEGGDDPRASRYLAAAGKAALKRHADREAADYLKAAVELLSGGGAEDPAGPAEAPAETPDLPSLKRELARARARLGQYGEARDLWLEVLAEAEEEGDPVRAAQAHRHLGLISFWTGEHDEALQRYSRAVEALGDQAAGLRARIHVAAGLVLQELGRPEEGRREVEKALALAEELGHLPLLGRVHRALALLFNFTGEAQKARRHGWKAVELADRCGDDHVAFWGRWALASLEGLVGGPVAIERLMGETRDVAERLRSPVLRLWVNEMEVEHAYYSGDWDRVLAHGERSLARAEALNQKTLLVRLAVITASCYLGRGDLERGRALVEKAWRVAGLDGEGGRGRPDEVHALVPAHIGRVALLMAEGEYEEAIEVGRKALAIADRVGYVMWVLHRLLPLVAEACLRAGRMEEAVEAVERLRCEGTRMDHRMALAYAAAGDAVVAWHSGRVEEATDLLRGAAEGLEDMGCVPEAARLRRQLAGRLAELDRREEALAELRAVHEVFGRLGAHPEFEKARGQFHELKSRPPPDVTDRRSTVLTPREVEVAVLVADRRSNKAVARELNISPRTVTTHLSNMYRKLEIGSRGELVDMVREGRLPLQAESPRA